VLIEVTLDVGPTYANPPASRNGRNREVGEHAVDLRATEPELGRNLRAVKAMVGVERPAARLAHSRAHGVPCPS